MSSILDALNKLEDEREREALNARAALDAELAARDLMGEGEGPRYTVSLGPIALAAAGIALVMVVAATAGLVAWMVRSGPADVAAVTRPVEVAPTAGSSQPMSSAQPPNSTSTGAIFADEESADPSEAAGVSDETPSAPPGSVDAGPVATLDVPANGWAQALALSAGIPADAIEDVPAQTTAPVSRPPAPANAAPAVRPQPVADDTTDSAPRQATASGDAAAPPQVASAPEVSATPELLPADVGPVVVSPPDEAAAPVSEPAPYVAPEPALRAPRMDDAPAVPAAVAPAQEPDAQLNAFEVAAKAPEPAPAQQNWPDDMRELPALSPAAKAQIGLEDFVVNMPMPATNARPVASAIINRMKVYKNERVLNTRVRLVDVATHGVAIEVIDTGERYYVRH